MDSGKWLNRFSLDCEMKYTNSSQTRNNYKSCVSVFLNRFQKFEQPKSIPTEMIERYLLELLVKGIKSDMYL